ncbi:hypothetical protein [Burkholderia sp. LMG 21824]
MKKSKFTEEQSLRAAAFVTRGDNIRSGIDRYREAAQIADRPPALIGCAV